MKQYDIVYRKLMYGADLLSNRFYDFFWYRLFDACDFGGDHQSFGAVYVLGKGNGAAGTN